jgi:hypothetical protein
MIEGITASGLTTLAAVKGIARGRVSVSGIASVVTTDRAATPPANQNRPVKPTRPTSAMPVIGPTASARLPAMP